MDRLSTLTLLAAALVACESKASRPAGDPPSRTNGAKVKVSQGATTEAFCDVHAADDRGAAFRWPELAPGSTAPGPPTTWRWVNLWATWCKPCIEEMPRLAAWRDKLAAAGKRLELVFVSVDESDAEVEAFRKQHPEVPPSIRVADADQRAAWLKSLGLGDGAIPIQLFVSPANRLRCARVAGVYDRDYAAVEKIFTD